MENTFYTLIDYMLCTKTLVYILMGGTLVTLGLFWLFLTGRDEDKKKLF